MGRKRVESDDDDEDDDDEEPFLLNRRTTSTRKNLKEESEEEDEEEGTEGEGEGEDEEEGSEEEEEDEDEDAATTQVDGKAADQGAADWSGSDEEERFLRIMQQHGTPSGSPPKAATLKSGSASKPDAGKTSQLRQAASSTAVDASGCRAAKAPASKGADLGTGKIKFSKCVSQHLMMKCTVDSSCSQNRGDSPQRLTRHLGLRNPPSPPTADQCSSWCPT